MGLFRALTIGLFILAIPVALITTNIRVAVSEQRVYDYAVQTYDAAAASGISEAELLRANGEIKHYLTSEDPGSLSIKVRNSRGVNGPLFTVKETAHMADVRDLVQALFIVQIISIAAALSLAVVMLVIWPPRALAMAALCGALLTSGILGGAALVAASGFDSAWTQLHQLAFSNDFWELDPDTDHLIQMFPEAFWQKITTLIVTATLLEAVLTLGVSGSYLLLSRPRVSERISLPAPSVAGPAGHSRPKLASPNPRHYFR